MSVPFERSEKKALAGMERRKGRTLRVLNTYEKQTYAKQIQFLEKEKQRSAKMIDLECNGYYDHLEQHVAKLYPNTSKCLLEEIKSQKDDKNMNKTLSKPTDSQLQPDVVEKQKRFSDRPTLEGKGKEIGIPFHRSKTTFETCDRVVPTKPSLRPLTDSELKGSNQVWGQKNLHIPLNPSKVKLPSQRKTLLLRCKTTLPENLNRPTKKKLNSLKTHTASRPTTNYDAKRVSITGNNDKPSDGISLEDANFTSRHDVPGVWSINEHHHSKHDRIQTIKPYIPSHVLPPVHSSESRPLVARSWSPPPRQKHFENIDDFKKLKFCRYLRSNTFLH